MPRHAATSCRVPAQGALIYNKSLLVTALQCQLCSCEDCKYSCLSGQVPSAKAEGANT